MSRQREGEGEGVLSAKDGLGAVLVRSSRVTDRIITGRTRPVDIMCAKGKGSC